MTKRVFIACVIAPILLLILLASVCQGQFYMYTPGTPIDAYINNPYDIYGSGTICAGVPLDTSYMCAEEPNIDTTMCHSVPSNVSPTASIDSTNLYSSNTRSSIFVACGAADFNSTNKWKLFFTTNGTLPDIFGPCYNKAGPTVCLDAEYVDYDDATGVFPNIVARCILNDLLPGRIAYARRIPNFQATCVRSMATPHYHELTLPRCDPALKGALCDGQTIVSGSTPPRPTSAATPLAYPTSTSGPSGTHTVNVHDHSDALVLELSPFGVLCVLVFVILFCF